MKKVDDEVYDFEREDGQRLAPRAVSRKQVGGKPWADASASRRWRK